MMKPSCWYFEAEDNAPCPVDRHTLINKDNHALLFNGGTKANNPHVTHTQTEQMQSMPLSVSCIASEGITRNITL